MTLARMIRQCRLPSTLHLSRTGLREMEDHDVLQVTDLFAKYMERFDMVPLMAADEIRHQLLSGHGVGQINTDTGRRAGQVVWSYVVEVGADLVYSNS